MSIYDQIENVAVGERIYFKKGTYLASFEGLDIFEKTNEQMASSATFKIVEILEHTGPNPNKVGSQVSYYNPLDVSPKGNLTQDGKRGMERIKSMLLHVLGGPEEGITEDSITGAMLEKVAKGETDLTGTLVIVKAVEATSKKTGKVFVNLYFQFDPTQE